MDTAKETPATAADPFRTATDTAQEGIVITIIPTATIQENETMVIGTVAIIANMRTAETAVITTLRGAMIITE